MTTFYTSDLHIGGEFATRIRQMGSTQAHDARIAGWWDENVGEHDTVVILGDVTEYPVGEAQTALKWLDERPGNKVLISGNWDWKHLEGAGMFDWRDHFDRILSHHPQWPLGTDTEVALHHYPYDHKDSPDKLTDWTSRDEDGRRPVLLHGHTHSKKQMSYDSEGTLQVHVGWDAWRRFPEGSELVTLIKRLNAKS